MNVVILNRWEDECSEYAFCVQNKTYKLHCITSVDMHLNPKDTVQIIRAQTLDDLGLLSQLLRRITMQYGPIEKIIALSEYDILTAAELRERFAVPGMHVHEALLVRDKLSMKQRLQDKQIATPTFCDSTQIEDVLELKAHTERVVVKPRRQAASSGVTVCRTEAEVLEAWNRLPVGDRQAEEFIDGQILHVDGFLQHGRLKACCASAYVGSCLDFNRGKPLGSIEITDKDLQQRVRNFTQKICEALAIRHSVFHLELILGQDDRLFFLEIGARLGGGLIPHTWQHHAGIDLTACAIAGQLGSEIPYGQYTANPELVSGFLMIPPKRQRPHRLRALHAPKDLATVAKQYQAEVGARLGGPANYMNLVAGYIFSGPPQQVRQDMDRILREFDYVDEPEPNQELKYVRF